MSMKVVVKISGTREEISRLQKLGDKLTNFSAAMKTIGDEGKTYYSGQAFASQGGVYGRRWPSLSPVYAKWKAKHYPGRGINIQTGTTQRSFAVKTTINSAMIYNTNENLFDYLQLGTSRMPARPMLGINNDIKSMVRQVIEADVQNKLRGM